MDGYFWWMELPPPGRALRGWGGNGTINSPSSKLLEAYIDKPNQQVSTAGSLPMLFILLGIYMI